MSEKGSDSERLTAGNWARQVRKKYMFKLGAISTYVAVVYTTFY